VVIPESTTWAAVEDAVRATDPEHLEAVDFVTVFRGKKVGQDRKSLTLRVRFRAQDRTLRREEVDPQVAAARQSLEQTLGGEVRD
jgi:phenylalanyl-tRNA synthetase beta chain